MKIENKKYIFNKKILSFKNKFFIYNKRYSNLHILFKNIIYF